MIYIFHIICLIAAASLQGTLMKCISVFGVSASLFVCYAVCTSFLSEKTEGVLVSGIFGLTLDVLIGRFIGFYTILFVAVSFAVSGIFEKALKEQRFYVCGVIVFIVSFLIEFLYYVAAFLLIGKLNLKYAVLKILIESVYNGFFSVPIYFVIKKIGGKIRADKGEYIE